jgi:uncharacterized protein YndB with AHSA1/START domain
MPIIDTELSVEGTPEALWAVWTDVDAWSQWDPHEQASRMIDPFRTGGRGYSKPVGAPGGEFTLTQVEAPHRWVSRSPLPGGDLTFEHTIEHLDDERCRLRLVATSRGPMRLVVRIGWGRSMRADSKKTLAALAARASAKERP